MTSKTLAEIAAELDLFAIRNFAVLVDDATSQAMIDAIPSNGINGCFSFTAAMAGRVIAGHEVRLLTAARQLPASEAWLVATPSKAGYGLNEFLRRHQREGEIIFTLAKEHVSAIYSYVDFVHGDTASVFALTNTFERGCKIHFPIAVRYLLRALSGEVRLRGQRLIEPNQTVVFDSREMGLADPFVGYFEAYTDIRHLNGEVTPFLHFNCDYVGPDSLTTIHQSGFKPWPAGSRFIRGLVPTDGENELTISLFNKTNDTPVSCQAELRFTRNGERPIATRALRPIGRDEMQFLNINEIFADELSAGAEAADVVIIPDRPLHRPNFYLHRRGKPWSWTAVEHGAALAERLLTDQQRADLGRLGVRPWICSFPILPRRFDIDTSVLYFQDGAAQLHDFQFELFDQTGRLVWSEELHLDFGQRVDVADWAGRRSLALDGGLLNVSPAPAAQVVPHSFSLFEAFQPAGRSDYSVVISGGAMPNIPFEWERSWMWNHPMVPTTHTEQFGRAVVDDKFDTIITLSNPSAAVGDVGCAELELDVYAADGRLAHFHRQIAANTSLTLSIGDLLTSTDLPRHGVFALWIYCRDRAVQGFHILQRRKDRAIGAQHFYYCRFNTLEQDIPIEIRPAMPQPSEPAPGPSLATVATTTGRARRLIRRFGIR